MSLRKKIVLGFLVSSIIIAVLVISGYFNFIEIRKEIKFLELSDTLRSKTLQLRRHEKNFFLYGNVKETKKVHNYLNDLKIILTHEAGPYNKKELLDLENRINEYEKRFHRIEIITNNFKKQFSALKPAISEHSHSFRLIESTFLERPLVNAELIRKAFMLSVDNPAVTSLNDLNTEINSLRSIGEKILTVSEVLDKSARERVDSYINLFQGAALFLLPLFLVVGLTTLFMISQNIVKRLQILTGAVERAGKGDFTSLKISSGDDEVGVLINAFIKMEKDLFDRDEELKIKSTELLQSKKLAAIGTLASGVAHELNNPLNNIYTSAQRLKKAGDNCPSPVKNGLDDIFSQTMRVKRIVADLLEFARGRELQLREVEINALLNGVYKQIGNSVSSDNVHFIHSSEPEEILIHVDPVQIEQVFTNIFINAVDAMSCEGILSVDVQRSDNEVIIKIEDSGKGIPPEMMEKIYEPFFTMKDRGTGLGLAIVFNIIKRHNGMIKVESEIGKGTVFSIRLPMERISDEL